MGVEAIRSQKTREYHREYMVGWRQRNRERARAISRRANKRYYEKNRAKLYAKTAARAPQKKRALALLNKAVARGDLTRPDVCSSCGGRPEGSRICGHHADYAKPLEVEWLCDPCHTKLHRLQV